MEFILFPLFFALAYAIKGGAGHYFFTNYDRENPISNKLTSAIGVFLFLSFITVFYQVNIGLGNHAWQSVLFVTLAWLVSIAPSLGEEYGALLGRKDEKYGKWMPRVKSFRLPKWLGRFLFEHTNFITVTETGYKITWVEGHEYGAKKAVQRGVFIGACMTTATGYVPFIWFSLAFVPLAWLCLNFAPRKWLNPWAWSEVAIGAVCYGVPMAMMIGGY